MQYIGDFHIHSKYSRATSKNMDLERIDDWAKIKGIHIVGTGDFTHPEWLDQIKTKLEPAQQGLFKLKDSFSPTRFILTSEISCIYSKNNKVRKVHTLLFAPSIEAVEEFNARLSLIGNLKSDGRPILGLDVKELAKIAFDASEDFFIVPAHIWTPWFSIFGSKSGFDSLEECFEEYSDKIFALETGLSSDPLMNWRISNLDKYTLISNSDAHSPAKLGREANIFEGDEIDYNKIIEAMKNGGKENSSLSLKMKATIEFFPEEGKYHLDGHRSCDVCLTPAETKKYKGLCPKCGKPLTVGVLYRVNELSDREEGFKPKNALPFHSLVPLLEIIGSAFGMGVISKRVQNEYNNLIKELGPEFKILMEATQKDLEKVADPRVSEAILMVRQGKIIKEPGYDGVFGKIKVSKEESNKLAKEKQNFLF